MIGTVAAQGWTRDRMARNDVSTATTDEVAVYDINRLDAAISISLKNPDDYGCMPVILGNLDDVSGFYPVYTTRSTFVRWKTTFTSAGSSPLDQIGEELAPTAVANPFGFPPLCIGIIVTLLPVSVRTGGNTTVQINCV